MIQLVTARTFGAAGAGAGRPRFRGNARGSARGVQAAGVAAVTQFLPELGGVHATSAPAFAQVGLVLVPLLRDLRGPDGHTGVKLCGNRDICH
jgi:hypothetical protein